VSDAAPAPFDLKIERLRKRPDFLACARAPACARGAVLVQARARDDTPLIRTGFTATKRIGGSVERNRAKRRLREAVRLLLPALARPGYDYVFIARGGVTTRPWPRLLDDVKSALLRLAAEREGPASDTAMASPPPTIERAPLDD